MPKSTKEVSLSPRASKLMRTLTSTKTRRSCLMRGSRLPRRHQSAQTWPASSTSWLV